MKLFSYENIKNGNTQRKRVVDLTAISYCNQNARRGIKVRKPKKASPPQPVSQMKDHLLSLTKQDFISPYEMCVIK